MEQLTLRTRIMLNRCRENNITISQKKLEMGKLIHFAGHIISDEGIQPDEEKYTAISRFPQLNSVRDLRSFLGLAQQLASFIPDLAHMMSTLCPLLKKGVAWTWTDDHENSFKEVKNLLTSKTIIHPFDQEAETFLLTDASRLHGLGFALMQQKDGEHFLIQCGSCSLTLTRQRFTTVELKCMAIQWAIKKSEFY